MPGGRAGTPEASCARTTREHESLEDREARLDRKRLRKNHLTPRQRWVPQLFRINVSTYQEFYKLSGFERKFFPLLQNTYLQKSYDI